MFSERIIILKKKYQRVKWQNKATNCKTVQSLNISQSTPVCCRERADFFIRLKKNQKNAEKI